MQQLWDSAKAGLSGGFAYSEGIFEDINKVICTQLFWQQDRQAAEIVREYCAAEFSPAVLDDVSQAIDILERILPRQRRDDAAGPHFVPRTIEDVEVARDLLERADSSLTGTARTAWRWRVLYLRALVDAELAQHGFAISPRCDEALEELARIYHVDDRTYYYVTPPSHASLRVERFGSLQQARQAQEREDAEP
jgi:hypothetical protein